MWNADRLGKFIITALPAMVLLATLSAVSFATELDGIRQAIKINHARWTAGENSMTKLPPAARRKRLGNLSSSGAFTAGTAPYQTSATQETSVETAPATLDWRAHNGNFVTPVRDQGQCGSCWAFAAAAAMESRFLISNSRPGYDLNLSEQVLVSCGGAGTCNGGYIDYASNYIRDMGLPLETCYPYITANGICSSACGNWQAIGYRISAWRYISATVSALKSALNTYGPLVTTFDVYSDFYAYSSGIYTRTSTTYEGGHAVLLVGYDDSNQCFIVKNSWGTGWGESGYFRISYTEVSTLTNFGHDTIAYESAYAVDSTPPSGMVKINEGASISSSNAVSLQLSASDANGLSQMCVSNTSSCSSWEGYATSKAWSLPIGDGEKTVYAWFRDTAGNSSATACSDTIILDASPPALNISTLSNGLTTSAQVLNVAGTVTDLTGVQYLKVNGTPISSAAADGAFSHPLLLSLGSNSLSISAGDQAGNTISDSRSITLDPDIPSLSIISPSDLSRTGASFCSLSGATEENATVEFSVNSGSPEAAALTGNNFSATANLNTGFNTLIVTSTSLGGKKNSIKRTVYRDYLKPDLAVSEPGQDIKTCGAVITIRGASSFSSPVSVTIEAGGQTYTPVLADGHFEQVVPLPDTGTYTIITKASDDSGNESVVRRNVIRVVPPDGDMNGDGKVNVSDVIIALQAAIGNVATTGTLLSHGDVAPLINGVPSPDLKITTADAVVLLQRAVGLVSW
ncbi:MAG: C1 family peptidase [Geobacteraceae bacterium]|nr:C1 family peptidase [Geobacteraceae bacterium]